MIDKTMKKKHITEKGELFDWAKKFTLDFGCFPREEDCPFSISIIRRCFGSIKGLKNQIINEINENDDSFNELWKLEKLHLRKLGDIRYCRFCGKILPRYRYNFCPDIPKTIGCMERFEQDNISFALNELEEILENTDKESSWVVTKNTIESRTQIWSKCTKCKYDCKIKLNEDQKEPEVIIICKKSPEWERISRQYEKKYEKRTVRVGS